MQVNPIEEIFIPEKPQYPPNFDKKFLKNNLVYLYTCSCGQTYVGQTKRRFSVRIHEHQTRKTSVIFKHSQSCSHAKSHIYTDFGNNYVDKNRFNIISSNLKHKDARLKYETIYINYYDKNTKSAMNECEISKDLAIF